MRDLSAPRLTAAIHESYWPVVGPLGVVIAGEASGVSKGLVSGVELLRENALYEEAQNRRRVNINYTYVST